ncbi:hypothetical protein BGZ93_004526 [Podila epicladia]|nr:hypothetical protein BGZ92_007808 [Podila epicladia]KAG0096436.1 hypothetical protein BGZ93_004526 [Podila epicladia]
MAISVVAPDVRNSRNCTVGSRPWCMSDQDACFVTEHGFKCLPACTPGWVIIPNLNVYYTRAISPNGPCSVIPRPNNYTLQEILILAIKRYDAYYRTSTILISDKPTSILESFSNCAGEYERCVNSACIRTKSLGEECAGNSECYNQPSNNATAFGPICDYEPGKLQSPPKCQNYIRIPRHPDNDPHNRRQGDSNYFWIYIVAALFFIILCVSLFMCWSYWGKASARHRRVAESEAMKAVEAIPSEMEDMQYDGGYLPATALAAKSMEQPSVNPKNAAGPTGGTGEMPLPHPHLSMSTEHILQKTLQPASGVSDEGETTTNPPPSEPTQRRYSMAEWAMQQRRDRAIDQAFVARIGNSRSNTHRTEQLCGITPGAPRRANTFEGIGQGA